MRRHFRPHADGSEPELPKTIIHTLEHNLTSEGRLAHISVQAATDKTGSIPADFTAQCEISMTHIEHMLAAARMQLRNMVRITCYLTSRSHLEALNTAWQRRWPGVTPGISVVVVAGLANPEVLVGFEVQAYSGAEDISLSSECISET